MPGRAQPAGRRVIGGICLLAAIALLSPAMRADHIDSVVISATASKGYLAQKFANGLPRPEAYAFYEGKYFAGDTHDASIANVSFMDIARILAPNLAKQNYFPAKAAEDATLLIVIDWGRTATDPSGTKSDSETPFELQSELGHVQTYNSAVSAYAGAKMVGKISPAVPDPADVTMDLMTDQANAMSAQKFAAFNSNLLGYTTSLRKALALQWASANGLSTAAEARLSELAEPRYFVALLAYDYQKMRHHGLPAGAPAGGQTDGASTPPQPVWSVRFNIRANGNSFVRSLPAMSRIAAAYFGKQFDDLKVEQTDLAKN
jgi:hypothetical protein